MAKSSINIFIVAGRTGQTLVMSKTLPFVSLEIVKSIYIFTESEGSKMPKCQYITIPVWIRKTKPVFISRLIRIFFEPIQLLFYAIKIKPLFINGIYCLPKGLNSYIISRITGIKCVNWVIGSRLEVETELPLKKMWEKINLWHLKGCEAISVKGQTDIEYLTSNGIARNKIFPLNGAIDTGKFVFTSGERPIDILFVGTFYELKGPDRVLKILKKLILSFPGIKAVMVGNGKMWQQTKNMATELGIIQNIIFEGYQKNIVPYYQQSKILIMPSRSEGLPTSMLEAMSCGCVPVMSNVGNIKEAAIHNFNSKVIDNFEDLHSFSVHVSDLLNNEAKRKDFAVQARNLIEDKYTIDAQAKIASQLIKEIFNGK
jgi:glycosyltransferase involved in cell wall biosynthesis